MMGVFRAPAGQISMGTGAFTPSGNALANITGQFWPYGIDGFIWASGIAAGTLVSPAAEGAYDRGMFSPVHQLIGNRQPLPETSRSDGPFVFATPAAAPEGVDSTLDPETGTCRMPDSSSGTLISGDASQAGPQCSLDEGGAPPIPGVIFVTPLTPNPVPARHGQEVTPP
jgi:hypothetical protein